MTALLLALMMATAEPTRNEQCLLRTLHYEARGESHKARVAVRDVVLNRVKKSGKGACKVVYEKRQFSWTAKKHKKRVGTQYVRVLRAKRVLGEDYLYFYSGKKPSWAVGMKCKRLDSQHFCKL